MKHTQGKWEVSLNECVLAGDKLVSMSDIRIPQKEREANAKLIASAPELLRELQTAVEHIKNIQEKYKPEKPFAVGGYLEAIKKATS